MIDKPVVNNSLAAYSNEPADKTYEELHETIAGLRVERGSLHNIIKDHESLIRDIRQELSNAQLKNQKLIEDGFKMVNESNKIICKLVDKIDCGSTW